MLSNSDRNNTPELNLTNSNTRRKINVEIMRIIVWKENYIAFSQEPTLENNLYWKWKI